MKDYPHDHSLNLHSEESVKDLNIKPEIFNLTLAESFDLHCSKFKCRLEAERKKFSCSRRKGQIKIMIESKCKNK